MKWDFPLGLLLLAVCCHHEAAAARILAMLPSSKSHVISFTALTTALAKRGHEVTLISNYQPAEHPNQKFVDCGTFEDLFGEAFDTKRYILNSSFDSYADKVAEIYRLSYFGTLLSTMFLEKPEVKDALDKPEGYYQAIIIEIFFGRELLVGLGHKFKAPVIDINSFGDIIDMNYFSGAPINPAFRPHPFLSFSDEMTFGERLANTLFGAFHLYHKFFEHYPEHQELLDKYFPGGPPLTEQLANIALHIVNSHHTLSYAAPIPPNVVMAGGMHIKHDIQPLPQNLRDFMDGAQNGVVYFSMGSFIKASEMSDEQKDAFIETFRKRKERFIVKWNAEAPKNKPSNVLLQDWLPQNDILAHPKMRGFITHGGLLGTQEALYHGVPVIGLPRFGDQRFNMRLAERQGYGVYLDLNNATRSSVSWALTELLDGDKQYAAAARRLSALLRSQPARPVDNAVFWVEHVMKHGGDHLRPASVYLSWYQVLLLDVILVLVTPVVLLGLLVCALCCRKSAARAAASPKKKES